MRYIRDIMARPSRRKDMENWKKLLIAGSAGASVLSFLKGRRGTGFFFGGVALAALASEYPEQFREIRSSLPQHLRRGATLLNVASRIGEHLGNVGGRRDSAWDEELV